MRRPVLLNLPSPAQKHRLQATYQAKKEVGELTDSDACTRLDT